MGDDATGPASLDAPRRRRLWLLAPWVVAITLGVVAAVGGDRGAEADSARPPATTSEGAATASAGDLPTSSATTPPPSDGPRSARPPELPAAVLADALAVARVALGSRGLELDDRDATTRAGADRWVLDQVPGELVVTGDGVAEVVVHATVISRTGTGWSAPTLAAARVPIGLRPTPHVDGAAVPIEIHAATPP